MNTTLDDVMKALFVIAAIAFLLWIGVTKNDPSTRAEGPCGNGSSLAC